MLSLNNHYFFLPENKALVKGSKYSIIIDFESGRTYRVNRSASRIIELGEQGFKVEEAVEKLGSELKDSSIISFIEKLVEQGLLLLSSNPKPQGSEKPSELKLDFIWIEVTPNCNLQCIHCYTEARVNKDEQLETLSKEEIEKVIGEAAELGCRKIQFTGGEPTLRSDLKSLIEYAKVKGFELIEIFTNGTLLTEPMIKFLAEQKVNVAMSIYSYRAKTHDAITKVPGSFEKTMNSLKLLLAYGVPTRCEIVAMRQNEKELEATSYFLYQLGVYTRPPDPIRPSGRGRNMENWPTEYGQAFLQTKPSFIISRENYEKNKRWNSCWFGKAAVTSSGNVIPCVFARDQVVGNVKHQSLAEIILGEKMLRLWGLNRDQIEVCRDCEYRYVCEDCRPWAYGLTGNLYAKSPRCTYNPYTGEWEKKENFS